jgi:hypothetical protein
MLMRSWTKYQAVEPWVVRVLNQRFVALMSFSDHKLSVLKRRLNRRYHHKNFYVHVYYYSLLDSLLRPCTMLLRFKEKDGREVNRFTFVAM